MKIQNSNVYLHSNSILETAQKAKVGYNTQSTQEQNSYASGNDKHTLRQLQEIANSNLRQNDETLDEAIAELLSNSFKQTIKMIKEINQREKNDFNIEKIESYKYQETSVNIAAKVKTADSQIDVNIKYNLKSGFMTQNNFVSGKNLVSDPLAISLNGKIPDLSNNTFEFDIDSDGSAWQISKLKEGSGFLALDKNNDGKINNGNELFGTKSGNGFADLAEFDDDKNGWIDENDAIFHKLRIWLKNDNEDRLVALGEVGIGAIFLGNVKSKMDLTSNPKTLKGELKSSGFFLKENGQAGVISQIDLVKRKEPIEDTVNPKNTKVLSTQKSFISASKRDLETGETSRYVSENFEGFGTRRNKNDIGMIRVQSSSETFINFNENKRKIIVTNTNKKASKFNAILLNTNSNLIKSEFKEISQEQRTRLQNRIKLLQNNLIKAENTAKKQSINQEILSLQTQLIGLSYS
ncbi:MAG: hypothetical protein ACTTJC_01805 [Campylobacter sp.]